MIMKKCLQSKINTNIRYKKRIKNITKFSPALDLDVKNFYFFPKKIRIIRIKKIEKRKIIMLFFRAISKYWLEKFFTDSFIRQAQSFLVFSLCMLSFSFIYFDVFVAVFLSISSFTTTTLFMYVFHESYFPRKLKKRKKLESFYIKTFLKVHHEIFYFLYRINISYFFFQQLLKV